ncbi:MAG: CBS domain-containing protein [Actinobacteria bacterium]|nr:CBS domain-containing protein [Actinomycetota bacterium]
MKKFLILTHVSADFDAAASCYAASLIYENSIPVLPGSPNKNVRDFLSLHSDLIYFYGERDFKIEDISGIVLTDVQGLERTGPFLSVLLKDSKLPIIVFDHHPSSEILNNVSESHIEKTGSTTTILVEKLRELGKAISPAEATFFALGIHEDTGSLTFKNSTERDAKALAWLYELGAQPELIYRFLHSRFSEIQSELLISLIRNAKHERIHDKILLFSEAQAKTFVDGASSVVHRLVDIYNPDFALVALVSPLKITLIARSSSEEIDCLSVLKEFEPSGHPEAAVAYIANTDVRSVFEKSKSKIKGLLKPEIKVKDIMSKLVVTVKPSTKIIQVLDLFKKTGHSGFPVVDRDKVVGIITRTEAEKAIMHNLAHAPVKGFMVRDVTFIEPDTSISDAVKVMMEEGIGRLPVVENNRLIGIITRTDVLRALHGITYYSKEKVEVKELILRKFKEKIPFEIQQLLQLTGFIADELGYSAYLVGGIVRDLILGYENLDFDIVVEGSAIEVAKRLAKSTGARMDAYKRFDTAVVIFNTGLRLDFATARTEYYEKPGALPRVQKSSIRSDLLRRDFTINALAFSLSRRNFAEVVDVSGGLKDLRSGTIRVLHSLSFIEDPTRIVRAVRFEAKFDFRMDETTEILAREAIRLHVLKQATPVRLRDEIFDLFKEEEFLKGIERAVRLGVMEEVFGPLKLTPQKKAHFKMISKSSQLREKPELKKIAVLSVLLMDFSDEKIEELATFFKMNSSDKRVLLESVRLLRMQDIKLTKNSEIFDFFQNYREESLLCVYHSLKRNSLLKPALGKYLNEIRVKKPPLTGRDLIEIGYSESPMLGKIKSEIFKLFLDGKIETKEEALAYAKNFLNKQSK